MPKGYSKEQVCDLLLQISNVVDLNSIKTTQKVKDVLPMYNGALAGWEVGVFLGRVKRGAAYMEYYDFLQEIGLNMKVEKQVNLIARTVRYCEAIDKLVEFGVDINQIQQHIMMSDFIEEYRNNDLKIGLLLCNARYGRVGKVIESKLREHNFNFDLKVVTRREKIKQVIIDVASVTDINKIPINKKVKDYIPDYNEEMADYKIGLFIQNVRAGDYAEYRDLLASLGFIFKNVKKRHTTQFICNAIDDLIEAGIDINRLSTTAKMSDILPRYVEDDLNIGELFRYARNGRVGRVIYDKLASVGFDFNKQKNIKTEVCDILREIAKVYDINTIKECVTVQELLPTYQGELTDFNIGRLITRARLKGDAEYEEILVELGLVLGRKKQRQQYSDDFVCKAIRDLVENGVNLNDVTLRSYMGQYIPSYTENDCHIGYFLSQARRGRVSERVKQELVNCGFDFNIKIKDRHIQNRNV